ncbi:hypothetical protein PG987_004251 [Apiospora arundinis]
MASSIATDIFEKDKVSSKISADEAPKIFQKYGIFYQPDAALARIAKNLGASIGDREGFDQLKNAIFHDQRLKSILEPYSNYLLPTCFPLGADRTYYYAFRTTSQTPDPDPEDFVLLYVWHGKTEINLAVGSQTGLFHGVRAANGLYLVPYPQIQGYYDEVHVAMEEGGVLILHPRSAANVTEGFARGLKLIRPPEPG